MSKSQVYTESLGSGQQVIFLHGWGMHSGLFRPVVDELKQYFNVLLVDLPGHGDSQRYDGFNNIDRLTDYLYEHLADQLADQVIICGWSTGSLVAQNLAIRFPELIDKLVLITGTPCFEKKSGWPSGVDSSVLEAFKNDLLTNFNKTLSRFLALQFMHSEGQKENLRMARELVFARPVPDKEMLTAGLQLLKSTDLRSRVAEIKCPTLIMNGERDSLIPTRAARFLAEKIKLGRTIIFKSAGHAPFLSHGCQFNQYLKQFLL
jgi:pimeloyl-[acyl-carrier protein] methyl ester esterase